MTGADLRFGARWILAAWLLAASAQAQAPVDLRVALVIGNSLYAAAPLVNPANDARAMSETLRSMGFSVVEVRDAKKAEMEQAIAQVRDRLKGRQGVGMLYYAGHGLQLDWRNYMVPIDAKIAGASDVPAQTVDVQQVVDAFKSAGNRMNIVVLDACRDNPFPATASGKGLAQMDAPAGTLLAFATAPGNVAEDGDSKTGNGLYTQFLVQEMKQPTAKIEDVFKRVRLQVRRRSEGRQVPWESTSLEEDFYFDPKVQPVKVRESDQLTQVEAALVQEKADWDRIKASTQPDDFYAYLQKYPGGLISEQAQFRLDQLQRAKVTPQPAANGVMAFPAGANRFVVGDEWVTERTDGFTKESRRVSSRVTQADNNRVVINGGGVIFDQMGATLKNRFGAKDPGVLIAPADLAIGKRWRSAFTNSTGDGSTTTNFYDFRVVAFEEVTVPAGTFKAFKVERSGLARPSQGRLTFLSGTAWIDPTTMFVVRNDVLFRVNGRITERSSDQLVSMKRAPRNP